ACRFREIVCVVVPEFPCLRPDEALRRGPGLDRHTRPGGEGPQGRERKRLAAGWAALKVPSSHVYGCCPFVFDRYHFGVRVAVEFRDLDVHSLGGRAGSKRPAPDDDGESAKHDERRQNRARQGKGTSQTIHGYTSQVNWRSRPTGVLYHTLL